MFIDGIKRRLHRDIVADPRLHARVLDLYRNGEAYPHRVDDYFPVAYVEEPELAHRMRRHANEEDKHVALYAKAIRTLGATPEHLPMDCVFNAVIRAHTPSSWAMCADDDRDARRLKLAHFLAHAHCLEKRVARSLDYHLEACAHASSPYPGKAVAAVLADEHGHVRYTREAVDALLPRRLAADLWAEHGRAERRANIDFSAGQLRRLLRIDPASFRGRRRPFYRACAFVLRGLLACA